MTNRQIISLYDKFLFDYCHCSADSVGNRPCDNGVCCSRCHEPDAQTVWWSVLCAARRENGDFAKQKISLKKDTSVVWSARLEKVIDKILAMEGKKINNIKKATPPWDVTNLALQIKTAEYYTDCLIFSALEKAEEHDCPQKVIDVFQWQYLGIHKN